MSGQSGKGEKGKTLAPTPSKTHPPLVQASLLPVVSKTDPALRRSTRASNSTGCQASGTSLPATAAKKVSAALSLRSKDTDKQSTNLLTKTFLPLGKTDAPRPASPDIYAPEDDPAELSDIEEAADAEGPADESDDEVVLAPPLPVSPPPLPPPLPVHPPPPAPPAPAPIDQVMADAAAAAAAVAAGIAAANQTASGIPPPPPFSGDTVAQCPQEWIRSLRYWLAF